MIAFGQRGYAFFLKLCIFACERFLMGRLRLRSSTLIARLTSGCQLHIDYCRISKSQQFICGGGGVYWICYSPLYCGNQSEPCRVGWFSFKILQIRISTHDTPSYTHKKPLATNRVSIPIIAAGSFVIANTVYSTIHRKKNGCFPQHCGKWGKRFFPVSLSLSRKRSAFVFRTVCRTTIAYCVCSIYTMYLLCLPH